MDHNNNSGNTGFLPLGLNTPGASSLPGYVESLMRAQQANPYIGFMKDPCSDDSAKVKDSITATKAHIAMLVSFSWSKELLKAFKPGATMPADTDAERETKIKTLIAEVVDEIAKAKPADVAIKMKDLWGKMPGGGGGVKIDDVSLQVDTVDGKIDDLQKQLDKTTKLLAAFAKHDIATPMTDTEITNATAYHPSDAYNGGYGYHEYNAGRYY